MTRALSAPDLARAFAWRATRARMEALTQPRTPSGRRHRERLERLAEHRRRQLERLLLGRWSS